MKQFISLLVALLLVIGEWTPAMADPAVSRATRHSFCIAGKTNLELARDVDEELKTDATGAKNHIKGCRVSPQELLQTFQQGDPDADLHAVADLPKFLREDLVLTTPPSGLSYWSACKDDQGRIIVHCLSRTPRTHSHNNPNLPPEKVYQNRKTGKIDLQGDCANPVEQPDVPKDDGCAEIWFYLHPGDEDHTGLGGTDVMPKSNCTALLKAGETEWSTLLLDECPHDCDFKRPAAMRAAELHAPFPVQAYPRISFVAEKEGWYRLRIPREWMMMTNDEFMFCVVIRDAQGTVIRQSNAAHISWRGFKQGRAFLGYQDTRLPADAAPNQPFHSWKDSTNGQPMR